MIEGRVYVVVSGGWAWAILDERGIDIMRGAGYETKEAAQAALDEEMGWLGVEG